MKKMTELLTVFSKYFTLAFILVVFSSSALLAGSRSDYFVDSDDFKDKNFKKGILSDYKDLKKGNDIDWVWIEKGVSLSDYKVSINSFEDGTDELSKGQLGTIKEVFKEFLDKLKGKSGTLNAEFNVYETQKYSPGKAWIPFAGGHQMQAGVGVEVLLKDKTDRVVAKIRHFARQGVAVESAAQETAEDLKKFISKN